MCGEVEKRTFRFTKHIASFYFFGTFRFADYIQEGFFRADINYSIVTQIARESVHYAMMNQLYKEHSIQEVFSNIILLFIRGICTLKGLQRLEDLS